jgi:hypothetical protein
LFIFVSSRFDVRCESFDLKFLITVFFTHYYVAISITAGNV